MSHEVSISIRALTTSVISPSVRMNSGSVSSFTTGFTRKFTRPKSNATMISVTVFFPVSSPVSVMSWSSQIATSSAAALAIVLTTKFFMCLIVADMIGPMAGADAR